VDNKRYLEFKKEIEELRKSLSASDFIHVIDTKLVDYLARNTDADLFDLRLLVDSIFPPTFKEFATEIFSKYDILVTKVNDIYGDIGTDVSREMSSIRALESINKSYLGKFSQKETEYIAKQLEKGISTNMTRAEIATNVSKISDTVSFYSDTIAQTQIKGYARNLKLEKAVLGEVDYMRYVDSTLRSNSHEFCIQEVARANRGISVHVSEIRGMSNGTSLPVITYCGGWRCLHDWEPDPFYKQ
jgi:hypothetical protein